MNECKEHSYQVEGEITGVGCPYCEIDRLKAELEEAKQLAVDWEYKHRWARPSSWESDMVRYYKAELEEAVCIFTPFAGTTLAHGKSKIGKIAAQVLFRAERLKTKWSMTA